MSNGEPMSEIKFQVGDKVEAFGCSGEVKYTDKTSLYPIGVIFEGTDKREDIFLADGRSDGWHKEPSLKLIERPKKKVPKTMYQAVYKESGFTYSVLTQALFYDEVSARSYCGESFIALGPAITFEVEE